MQFLFLPEGRQIAIDPLVLWVLWFNFARNMQQHLYQTEIWDFYIRKWNSLGNNFSSQRGFFSMTSFFSSSRTFGIFFCREFGFRWGNARDRTKWPISRFDDHWTCADVEALKPFTTIWIRRYNILCTQRCVFWWTLIENSLKRFLTSWSWCLNIYEFYYSFLIKETYKFITFSFLV